MSNETLVGRWFWDGTGKTGGQVVGRASDDVYLVRAGAERLMVLCPVATMVGEGWVFFNSGEEAVNFNTAPAPQLQIPAVAPTPVVAPQPKAQPQPARPAPQPQVPPTEPKKVDPNAMVRRVRRD